MANTGPLRSGRGVTTSDSMNGRGPRCGRCAEFVAATWKDANGTPVCADCGGDRRNDGIVVVVEGPDEEYVEEGT